MPRNNKKNKDTPVNPMPLKQIVMSITAPRGSGGGGDGVTMQQVNQAISAHNFAPSSHSGAITTAIYNHNNATDVHQYIVDKIALREVLDITIDSTRTELTITYADNTQEVVALASVNLHVDFDEVTNELIILDENDVEISRVDLSALIPVFTGYNGTHITTSVYSNQIRATLNADSITENELASDLQDKITSIENKIPLIVGGNPDNLTSVGADGEVVDSGYAPSDFAETSHTHYRADVIDFAHTHNIVDLSGVATAEQGELAETALQSFTETDPIFTAALPTLALKSDLTGFVTQGNIDSSIAAHNTATSNVHQFIIDKIALRDVLNIKIDSTRTQITITYADNTQEIVELASVSLHVDFDETTNELIILDENDVEISRVDLSALIPSFAGYAGTHITTNIYSNQIRATLNAASVTENELSVGLQSKVAEIDNKMMLINAPKQNLVLVSDNEGQAVESDLELDDIVTNEMLVEALEEIDATDVTFTDDGTGINPLNDGDETTVAAALIELRQRDISDVRVNNTSVVVNGIANVSIPYVNHFTILTNQWVASTTHSGYGFEAAIAITGAKAGDMFVGEIDFGDYQASVDAGITRVPGYVTTDKAMIYAVSIPTSDLHGIYSLIRG
jgi:hypothetical protein